MAGRGWFLPECSKCGQSSRKGCFAATIQHLKGFHIGEFFGLRKVTPCEGFEGALGIDLGS